MYSLPTESRLSEREPKPLPPDPFRHQDSAIARTRDAGRTGGTLKWGNRTELPLRDTPAILGPIGPEVGATGSAVLWVVALILLGMFAHATWVAIQAKNEVNGALLRVLDAQNQVIVHCSGQALIDCLSVPAPC